MNKVISTEIIRDKKCKKCGVFYCYDANCPEVSERYCRWCYAIIQLNKMPKKELARMVMKLREEVDGLRDEMAGIDL